MRIFRLFLLLICILSISSSFYSQIPGIPSFIPSNKNTSKPSKVTSPEFRVAEEILIDVNKLPLPQDRAYVLSKVGEFFCEHRERERAEELFAKSIHELMFAQTHAKESEGNAYENLIYGNFPRSTILSSISQCDKQLALNYLYKSRPQKLISILDNYYRVAHTPTDNLIARAVLHWEIVMEFSNKQGVITKNPENLVQFIEDDFETSIGYKTLDYLKELYKTDPILANKLTENAVKQILKLKLYDYQNKTPVRNGISNNMWIAGWFLRTLGKENSDDKQLMTVSDNLLRELVDKISQEITNSGYISIDEFGLRTV
jgi:hypothetical protein